MSTPSSSQRFLFLVASTRPDGNAEQLARIAARALPDDVEQQWLRLVDHPLEAFVDRRHAEGYGMPQGNGRLLLDATLAASDLVFVTPVYWYSLPTPAKLYLDHWSWWMRLPEMAFKERMAAKRMWVITVCSNEPGNDHGTEPLIGTLRLSAEYMSMPWMGALIGHANRPGEILHDTAVIERAHTWLLSHQR